MACNRMCRFQGSDMLPCLLRVSLRAAPAALLLLVLAPTAVAQPLTCGRFINGTDSAELVLEGPDRGAVIFSCSCRTGSRR